MHLNPLRVPAVVGSIMVVGVLKFSALLHSLCDLKFTQMNVQGSLIQDIMLYKFKLEYNAKEATKNITCTKGEGAVDHSTETRRFKKFSSGCRNLNDKARSGRLWISSPSSKPLRQIRRAGLGEYQPSLASYSPM